ncbi:MAG TPA: hypothetical protein VL284_01545 [Thermoanaerobaculia bacterium]|nr:hypothetical protein [Thermoanaerobaculia bacterium]
MRRTAALLLLVTLAACASNARPRALAMQVFEQRGRYRAMSVAGQHAFAVRITNRSEETISVDAISLNPSTTSLQFSNSDQTVGLLLESGETQDVSMFVDVQGVAGSPISEIDFVDVSVTCHSPQRGTFTETQSCSVASVSQ